ncbi:MAG: protein translocase subunit SecD [Myxococcota bacterium]
MKRKWVFRALLFTFIGLFSTIYLLPTFVGGENLPSWFTGYFNKKVLKGLDLAGGIHLEYAIDSDVIIEEQLENWAIDIKTRLREEYGEKDKDKSDHFKLNVRGNRLELVFKDKIDEKKLEKATGNYTDERDPKLIRTGKKENTIFFTMDSSYANSIEDKALERAVETIRDRVDEFGVASPEIYNKGNLIVVELPGLDKRFQERIKRIIMRSAHLSFKMVDSSPKSVYMKKAAKYLRDKYGLTKAGLLKKGPYKGLKISFDQYKAQKSNDVQKTFYFEMEVPNKSNPTDQKQAFIKVRKKLETLFREELPAGDINIPSGREIGYQKENKKTAQGVKTSQKIVKAMLLYKNTKVTGEYIIKAQVGYDKQKQAVVHATFNRTGGKYFAELTGNHIGWKMAIKLDKWVTSAPVIQDEIFENVQISVGGIGSPQQRYREAEELVGTLRSGSLPAPLTKEMELNVGPSLGKEAIMRGEIALGIGALLVIIFMGVYYRKSGLIAISALGLNVLLLLAIMATFEARLTLPGMAGIVLTLGMAVDANVIIFERIREELKAGKSPRSAIDSGYSKAFWTIIDSQITTAIAGIVLFEFGTGPIKGFAVTLIIGIITSIITGVFFTRVIFDWLSSRKKLEKLSI